LQWFDDEPYGAFRIRQTSAPATSSGISDDPEARTQVSQRELRRLLGDASAHVPFTVRIQRESACGQLGGAQSRQTALTGIHPPQPPRAACDARLRRDRQARGSKSYLCRARCRATPLLHRLKPHCASRPSMSGGSSSGSSAALRAFSYVPIGCRSHRCSERIVGSSPRARVTRSKPSNATGR